MKTSQKLLSHPVEYRAEVLWTVALGAAGQLLLCWALGKAAQSAQRRDRLLA